MKDQKQRLEVGKGKRTQGDIRINVILKRVRKTIFDTEKQYVLRILSVCM
jgi:hypothetical protein